MGASEYLKNRAQQQRDSAQGKGTVSDFLKNKASEQRKRQEEEKKASSKVGAFSDNGGAVVRQFLESLEAPEAPKAAHTSSFTWNVPTDAQTRHQRAQAVSMGQFQQDQTLLRKYGGSYENYLNDNRRSFDSAAEYEETVARAREFNSQLDLQNAQNRVAQAQKTGETMAAEQQRLQRSAENLQTLLARYQQTGSVVDGQSYLIAVESHNQAVEAYNEQYAAYEKEWETAQKGYETARQRAVKDQGTHLRAAERLEKEQAAAAERTLDRGTFNTGNAGGFGKNQPGNLTDRNLKAGIGRTLFDAADAGAGEFNKVIAETVKLIAKAPMAVEDLLTGEHAFTGVALDPVLKWADWVIETADYTKKRADAEAAAYGLPGTITSQLLQGTVAALPNTMLAILSGGGSAVPQIAGQAGGLVETARQAVLQLSKNPLFWTSMAQTLGSSYEEALADGATEGEALVAAVLTAFANSAIEVGGGMETLPGELQDANLTNGQKAWRWLKSGLEEGGEELIQNPLQRLVNKVLTGSDVPLFDLKDQNAVLNPVTSAQEFAGGAAIGLILGGGTALADAMLNPYQAPMTQEQAMQELQTAYQRFKMTGSEQDAAAVIRASRALREVTGGAETVQAVGDLNGGTENGTKQNPERAESFDRPTQWGASLDADESGGTQRNRAADRSGEVGTPEIDGYVEDLRKQGKLRNASTASLNVDGGVETDDVGVINHEDETAELREIRERGEKMGVDTIFVTAPMTVNMAGRNHRITGEHKGDRIIVQVNNRKMEVQKTAAHEMYHVLADKDPELVQRTKELLETRYSTEQLNAMFQKYEKVYSDVYSRQEGMTEELVAQRIYEEMLADAYAEYGRFAKQSAADIAETVQEAARPVEDRARGNVGVMQEDADARARARSLQEVETPTDQQLYKSLAEDETIKRLIAERDDGIITQEEYQKQLAEYAERAVKNEESDARANEDTSRFSLEGYEEELPALIEEGKQQAITMEPVREMTGQEFGKSEKNLTDQVTEYFEKIGGKADHPILGEVTLSRRGVKDDIAHGIGRKKAITFLAVPDVIEKGGMIDYQENWKGRGYDTAVVAAPVTIAEEPYMMGVVLMRSNGENRFYVHEVLTESNEGAAPFKTGAVEDGDTGGDAPSVISLLQNLLEVKKNTSDFAMENETEQETPAEEEVLDGDSLTEQIYHTAGGYDSFMLAQPKRVQDMWNRKITDAAKSLASGMWADRTDETFAEAAADMAQTYMEQGTIPTAQENKWFDELYQVAPEHKGGKKAALREYRANVRMMMSSLNEVRRYIKAKLDSQTAKDQEETVSVELDKLWERAKLQRRNYERTAAKHLLTEGDRIVVGQLLKGETSIWKISPKKHNRRGIIEVYEAKQAYEDTMRRIRVHKLEHIQFLNDQADSVLEMLEKWKDKKAGLLYQKSTMERNIRDIAPNDEIADRVIEEYFAPVHRNEAKAIRLINRMRDSVKKLKLSQKESEAVQLIGEATDNIEALKNRPAGYTRDGKTMEEWQQEIVKLKEDNPKVDWEKIDRAVEVFRSIYDELFQMQNEARIRNGYEPISYRKGYFPHFQNTTPDGILASFGRAFGVSNEVTALPTTINGLTKNFKPGIRWTGHSLKRTTGETTLDAVEGFDRYIEAAADVIYHTDDIQRLRALANRIRYKASDQGLRDQVDEIKVSNKYKTQAERDRAVSELYKGFEETGGRYALSNFVVELEEYTNILANKKSEGDRQTERKLGRAFYNASKAFEGRVGANMVAVNPASWLTNFIPITQAWGAVRTDYMIAGLGKTVWNDAKQLFKMDTDGIVDRSTFLTNRRGTDRLAQKWEAKASKVLTSPMAMIDELVSDTIVRARYLQNLKQGLSDEAALDEADAFAASVIADRSKGALPTIFNEKNAATKLLTMFQVEQINQFEYFFKDLPKEARKKNAAFIVYMLAKVFLGAWLYNEWYEKLVGRRPAFDPVGMISNIVKDIADGTDTATVILSAGGEVLEQIPFVGGLMGGGRIPISSALPDVQALINAGFRSGDDPNTEEVETISAGERFGDVFKELRPTLLYTIPSFGGGQVKKIWETLEAVKAHGSYSASGALQYPVFSDDPGDKTRTLVTGMILGKSSLPEAVEWVENDFKGLSVKYTEAYQALLEQGENDRTAYETVKAVSDAQKTEEESAEVIKRRVLMEQDVSDETKLTVYCSVLASDRELELIAQMQEEDASTVYALMNSMYGISKASEKRDAISASELSEEAKEKAWAWTKGSGEKEQANADERLTLAKKYGMYIGQVVEMENADASFETLGKLGEAGVGGDAAYELTLALREAENANGTERNLNDLDRYGVIMEELQSERERRKAIEAITERKDFQRMLTAERYLTTGDYNNFLKEYQKMYPGKDMNQERAEEVLNGMKLTDEMRAVIWQIATNGKDGKKNPFDDDLGKEIYDLVNEDDDGGIDWAGR